MKWKVAQRELATGFTTVLRERNIENSEYKFVAEVVDYDAENRSRPFRQRNVIHEGDQVGIYGPASVILRQSLQIEAQGNKIDRAPNLGTLNNFYADTCLPRIWCVAEKKALSICKEDGTSASSAPRYKINPACKIGFIFLWISFRATRTV